MVTPSLSLNSTASTPLGGDSSVNLRMVAEYRPSVKLKSAPCGAPGAPLL